jgi:hypothetical protein
MAPKAAPPPIGGPQVYVDKDAFIRAEKIKEAGLKPGKPKGDLTVEDLSHPPSLMASCPEFKAAQNYWANEWVVKFSDRNAHQWPADMLSDTLQETRNDLLEKAPAKALTKSASDPTLERKSKKEVQDMLKFMKGQVKQAEKTKKAFLKQVEKCEKKEDKRVTLIKQIKTVKEAIDDDLSNADEYARKNKLFALKYLFGSKLGADAPTTNVLIVIEISDKIAPYMENIKNDILAFFATVIEKTVESFNLIFFSSAGIVSYMPTFTPTVPEGKVKKGAADCQKWLQKQFTPKAGANAPWPPDWLQMVEWLTKDEENMPSSIYLACSKVPMPNRDPLNRINDFRALKGITLPTTVVSYEPEVEGDFNQEEFFREFVGPDGSFEVDSSKAGMEMVDKTLADVKKKKKQFDKFNKKLDKMEDMSDKLTDFKGLLYQQISIENLVRNDWMLHEKALKTPAA